MGIKEQFIKIKENWLMIVLALVVLFFISGGNGFFGNITMMQGSGNDFDGMYMESFDKGMTTNNYRSGISSDFAPEVEDRKIVKTSSLSNEIERGRFGEAEVKFKNIVSSSGAYLLNEMVNRNGEGWKSYYSGSYSLKIDANKYDAVVAQLKEIGEVQSFSENMADVTGKYESISIEVEVEKARLLRYLEMYEEAQDVSDKIDLNDRIFNQERRIKYLEDSLRNIDNRISYSSISFRMDEERSEYASVVFVKISSLVKSFIGSFNSLISLIFVLIPWIIALIVIGWGWKHFKK